MGFAFFRLPSGAQALMAPYGPEAAFRLPNSSICSIPFVLATYNPQLVTRNTQPLLYAFALTGRIAFSGHIWAQTAQPVHRLASILTRSFQI